MDSHPSPAKPKSSKQACDNCRRRKIKCSRELPCDKCQRLLLSCSYSDVLRRKGPKFRTIYPLAPIHPLVSRQQRDSFHQHPQQYPSEKQWTADTVAYPLARSPTSPPFTLTDSQYLSNDVLEPLAQLPPPELVSSPDSTNSLSDSTIGIIRPYARRLSAPVLLAHVNVYLKYLFPIMPVVRRQELQRDCHRPELLSSQRYAFLASLCAATHIQLKLDGTTSVPDPSHFPTGAEGHSCMSGEELLAEAVRARKDCDVVEDLNMDSLLTSFFLFASYGNLDKQDHAWFYLCQATSMVFTLGLNRESTYAELSVEEAEERRRVFWLLFVTERGYALQQAKPVMLRNSIHKPQVLCSEDPILAYGFINLISIFEKLSVNLFDWISAGGVDSSSEIPPTSAIQSSLCKTVSLEGVSEIQKVDILITQQWLQAMMWKLSMTRPTQPGSRDDAVLPFHLPVMVGKAVMNVISAASQDAVDAHGIGMEQKLFDLGTAVADVTRSLGSGSGSGSSRPANWLTESAVDPRELLWGILTTLSRIRGSQSHLFPTLLERCKGALDFTSPLSMGEFLALPAPPPPPPPPPPSINSNNNNNNPSESWNAETSALDIVASLPENLNLQDDPDDGDTLSQILSLASQIEFRAGNGGAGECAS
ncbi:putative C6 transcription factor (AmyR) [Aspergillus brunneoviolaceus CBS 621.78]|uniref:Amylase cluster transcriptional regulator AmyR n=1 Tax=Aspergillus brunneoviolaceus CBS 621.78 TaxID=1450534 RepID=A0ACD1GQR1_9EURO|nr:amylase cluster transcriptional regulator AmyR [Aspergillus brunneoviolaceus CBS 621.78]RAH51590.1 amylase cluster transcriptional regulator AmyR [Aspergillus brunneoviolaceus CBS 621.78]